jgi:general stress protein 26
MRGHLNKDMNFSKGLKDRVLEVIKGSKIASLATIVNGKPWTRFVVSHNDGINLHICTYRDSRKVKQIKKNPNVHIAISKDLNDLESAFVQISGKAFIRSDAKIKKRYWSDFMKKYYSGIDDPNYVVIEVKPEYIEYKSTETKEAQVLKIQ